MLGPLPRLVAPFRDETITSYLHRLAGPNHIDPAGLRYLLTRSDRKDAPVPLGRLAALAGMPGQQLACAMPQICTAGELPGLHIQNRPRARHGWSFTACRPCTAGQPVTRWALHDDVVCGRHRRWISTSHEQPDLTAQPEILRAHQRHRRLIRRHGRDPVMRALRDARSICTGWRLDGLHDPGFGRRMEIFCGPGWDDPDQWAPQAFDAAAYPQAVALARLLASPYWRERILGTHWAGHDEFTAELRRTVAPDYTWDYRPPAGAAAGTTRCSNGDCKPAVSSSSRSRPATPGTCPKPSSSQDSRRPEPRRALLSPKTKGKIKHRPDKRPATPAGRPLAKDQIH